jgi:hypothetical protein
MKKIHNTTTAVDAAYATLWLREARDKYMPALLESERVSGATIIRVPHVEGMSEGVETYTVQIYFESEEDMKAFLNDEYDELQCLFSPHLKVYAHSFSLSLDVIENAVK